MYQAFPLWVIVIDYILGMIMWTLIGRFAMGIFLRETSNFFFMRFFVRVTDPLIKLFAPITPGFLIPQVVPLYVAWFFFMIRFYRDAVAARIYGHGDALFPAGRRDWSRYRPHSRAVREISA